MAYYVGRRTREIGIRMALGSARARVLGLIMRQGLGVAAVGLVVGCLIAIVVARMLSGILTA